MVVQQKLHHQKRLENSKPIKKSSLLLHLLLHFRDPALFQTIKVPFDWDFAVASIEKLLFFH